MEEIYLYILTKLYQFLLFKKIGIIRSRFSQRILKAQLQKKIV
jgi:hypothetical protein